MTIAICFMTEEGVVLGTDSTSTYNIRNPNNTISVKHFNHAQKIFEVGHSSSFGPIGIAIWGEAKLGDSSHRTAIAEFSDHLENTNNYSFDEVINHWANSVWTRFSTLGDRVPDIARARILKAKQLLPNEIAELAGLTSRNDRTPEDDRRFNELIAKQRTPAEELELTNLEGVGGGFFMSGRKVNDRSVKAYSISYNATLDSCKIECLPVGSLVVSGVPEYFYRNIFGYPPELPEAIMNSGHWTGGRPLLDSLLRQFHRNFLSMPIRDAVDMVYSLIFTTIKGLRFSQLAPLCGGPIEIATITSDRPFRWVRHKVLDVAIHQALFNET